MKRSDLYKLLHMLDAVSELDEEKPEVFSAEGIIWVNGPSPLDLTQAGFETQTFYDAGFQYDRKYLAWRYAR